MNKNKRSGKYFENKIAELLGKALGLNSTQCRRASHSGSASFEFGDIYFYDYNKYDIVFECKFTHQRSLTMFFPNLNTRIQNYIKQLKTTIERFEKSFNKSPRFYGVILGIKHGPMLVVTDIPINVKTFAKINDKWFVYNFKDFLEVLKHDYR